MPQTKPYNYPSSLPLATFFRNAQAIRKTPIPFHRKFFNAYGDTFSVRIGRRKYLLLSRDKEVTQHILRKNHKNYYKSTIQTHYLSKYLGQGLLTANGDFWLRQRRLIQPAFHKQKMESLVDLMYDTIEEELSDLVVNTEQDVYPMTNHLAFKIVANALFDVSISEDVLKRLQHIIEKIQLFLVKEVRLPHLGWWFKLTGEVSKHKKLAEETRSIIREIIEDRKKSDKNYDDLLDMLLATRYEDTGEPMSTEQLIDEISILFVAGHETTANALAFTLFLLAKHPQICDTVYDEVSKVDEAQLSHVERIKRLVYTKATIDEAMRLYPPAWITDRENLEDDTIGSYNLRARTLVGVSFYELHRNPKYWERPDEFDPTRFIGEQRKKTAGVYYPFGAGPRMCIGMGFAVYEMVLAVAHIVKHYHLETTREEVGFNALITLKPIGAHLSFVPR